MAWRQNGVHRQLRVYRLISCWHVIWRGDLDLLWCRAQGSSIQTVCLKHSDIEVNSWIYREIVDFLFILTTFAVWAFLCERFIWAFGIQTRWQRVLCDVWADLNYRVAFRLITLLVLLWTFGSLAIAKVSIALKMVDHSTWAWCLLIVLQPKKTSV